MPERYICELNENVTREHVENCMHIDLYDDVSKIPFDRLESFFKAM